MCGILGVVGGQESGIDVLAIRNALGSLKHRGPDDEGYLLYHAATRTTVSAAGDDTIEELLLPPLASWATRSFDVALGHRRLSIIDVSPAGHQPMTSTNGRYWIAFNGEVYNFIELRHELSQRGHCFRSGTDTEVILAAYAEWGAAMLSRFVGMFAFAILDTIERTVFLARDPFGIKPLYWARSGNSFLFASEITPLLSMRREAPTADVDSLYRFMRFGVTDGHDATMFEGIHQIPAAHYLVLAHDGSVHTPLQAYWAPTPVQPRTIGFDDASRELRHLFDESVRLHLRSDVPLGACLSGGLDSTAIVASMRAQLGVDAPIHAFSYINEDPSRGEGPYVDIASRAFGLEQHAVSPSSADLLADLDTLVRTQEQPFDTTSIYAQYTVFRLAHQYGVTVMLDGQGSDELFGGYATAVSAQLSSAIGRGNIGGALSLVRSSHMTGGALRTRIALTALGRLLPTSLVSPLMSLVGEPLFPKWLDAQWFRARGLQPAPRVQGRGRDALREELMHFLQTLSLPRLLRYEDRNSMAFSIESRVPFCTVALANFAFSLPSEYLIGWDGQTKAILRRAMSDIVPRAIIDRPKVGFETPERQWLNALRPWISDVVESDSFRSLPFISHSVVDSAIDAQLRDPSGFRPLTWRFLNVAAWARQFNVLFDD
jgi:asparagine synthase (glutamine-hydrolysing)